ncbi:unnamed protein product [Caenorhabditis sp. 36 PRJEB53466]|nr:unnamed protein product [Caenorhabditis sp. 36 PRJEB53466]
MVNNVFISAVTTDTLSRKEAVAWVNNMLKSHFTKVEEMSSGAAYCQLTHLLFNAINLRKVKFNPRNEPDVLNNWKVLTTAWKDLGVDKPVDVERMKKGKFQDNMEFLQWFYKFFNANLPSDPDAYDAVSARFGEDLPALKGAARPAAPPVRSVPPVARPLPPAKTATPSVAQTTPPVRNGSRQAPATSAGTRKSAPSPSRDALVKEIEEHKSLAAEWETMAKEMETEREFYFAMLQKVEGLLHLAEENKTTTIDVEALRKVLYEGNEESVSEEKNEKLEGSENGNAADSTLDQALVANLDDTETF